MSAVSSRILGLALVATLCGCEFNSMGLPSSSDSQLTVDAEPKPDSPLPVDAVATPADARPPKLDKGVPIQDQDKDGYPDGKDNCPTVKNADQKDQDGDKVGDACDNCVKLPNPKQENLDGDKLGDACDNCPESKNDNQQDKDKDTVGDLCDNCPDNSNKTQVDLDGDKQGDACDVDKDGDNVPNAVDPRPNIKDTVYYFSSANKTTDYTSFGTWTAKGLQLCQTQSSKKQAFRMALQATVLPQTDYLAETKLDIAGYKPETPPDGWPDAALIFRVQSVGSYQFFAYACSVDPQSRRLLLAKVAKSSMDILKATPKGSIPAGNTFRVQVQAQADKLTCKIVGGPSLQLTDSTYLGGTVGFATYRTHTCYHYLVVMK